MTLPAHQAERAPVLAVAVAATLDCGVEEVDVRFWRAGADYGAFRVSAPDLPLAILRVPHQEQMHTAYDGFVDYREVVAREVAVHAAVRMHGIAAPRVLAADTSHAIAPWSWLLLEYIEHTPVQELSPPQEREVGRIARQIHNLSERDVGGPVLGGVGFLEFMRTRLLRRLESVAESWAVPGDVREWSDAYDELLSAYSPDSNRLLHMDLRAENVCVRHGQVVGVLDFTNAIMGDRRCELGRVMVYGLATADFQLGYGEDAETMFRDPMTSLYAADTAAMLALLARDELEDPDFEREMVGRTRDLLAIALD
jgi:aminoglycoside phosphotransferase (APT) family kinase protein